MEKQSKSELRDNIQKMLCIYKSYIDSQNRSGLFNINKDCEHIFCEFLNALYDLDLINLNDSLHSNYDAIDLGDVDNKICVQVTSQNRATKIRETINKFEKNKMQDSYSKLYFLILGRKKSYKDKFPDYVTIIDLTDLSDAVAKCHYKNILNELQIILHDQLGMLNLIDEQRDKRLLKKAKDERPNYGNSYTSFFEFCGCAEYVTKEDVEDINNFASQLSFLNYELREVIYAACLKRLKRNYFPYKENVHFNASMVAAYLIDKDEVYNCYRQLMQLEYLHVEDDEDDVLYFTFWNRGKDYDILQTVVDFCEKEQHSLDGILLKLDFRHLN